MLHQGTSQKRKAEMLTIPGASSDSNVFRSCADHEDVLAALHDTL
jgi:hypothetical protein